MWRESTASINRQVSVEAKMQFSKADSCETRQQGIGFGRVISAFAAGGVRFGAVLGAALTWQVIALVTLLGSTALAPCQATSSPGSLPVASGWLDYTTPGQGSDRASGGVAKPNDLSFTPTLATFVPSGPGCPSIDDVVVNQTKPFPLTITSSGRPASRIVDAMVTFTGKDKSGAAVSKRYDLHIQVKAPHLLRYGNTTPYTHVYILGDGDFAQSLLGLQEPTDGILRLWVQNDTALDTDVTSASISLYDSNGVPLNVDLPLWGSETQTGISVGRGDHVFPVPEVVAKSEPQSTTPDPRNVIGAYGHRIVTADLAGAGLAPGTYRGFLSINAERPTYAATPISFTLDVRSSPLRAIACIVGGLIVGYLVFWLNGVRQAYTEQLASIANSIENSLKGADQHVLDVLDWRYQDLKARVDPDDPDEIARWYKFKWLRRHRADPSLDSTLASDIGTLRDAVAISTLLLDLIKRAQTAQVDISDLVATAWTAIVVLDLGTARATMNEIEGKLFAPSSALATQAVAAPAAEPAAAPSTSGAVAATSTKASLPLAARQPQTLTVDVATSKSSTRRAAIRTAPDLKGTVRTIQIVRRFTAGFGMVLLLFTGLNVLYVGVAGWGHSLLDPLKAVGWGFATGAAGRGLSSTIATWASNLLP
jgi:hypothetical protein